MEKDEVIEFLQKRLDKLKENEPDAFAAIQRYEDIITDLMSED